MKAAWMLAAVIALAPGAVKAATYYEEWGHEACTVEYVMQGTIKIVVNGCSPNQQGSSDGTWFRMKGPYPDFGTCNRAAQAVIAQDPPWTSATCIKFGS